MHKVLHKRTHKNFTQTAKTLALKMIHVPRIVSRHEKNEVRNCQFKLQSLDSIDQFSPQFHQRNSSFGCGSKFRGERDEITISIHFQLITKNHDASKPPK